MSVTDYLRVVQVSIILVIAGSLCIEVALAAPTRSSSVTRTQSADDTTISSRVAVIMQPDGNLTCAGILGNRDLSSYDVLESPDRGSGSIPELSRTQAAAESAARSFVWDHWKQKRRGYAQITFYSVDSVSTFHLVIEPDEVGRWRIVFKIVRHSGILHELPVIRHLNRLARGTKADDWISISADDLCDPGKFKLEFCDERSTFVTGW